MASIYLDGLELPGDLVFRDEYSWCEVDRAFEYTLGGTQVIEQSIKLAGRPITLEATSESSGHIWLSRSIVEALIAKAATANLQMTLILSDSRTFTVMFRDEGVTAEPVYHVMPHDNGDPYHLTIKLMTV